jgi:hypothetical protein
VHNVIVIPSAEFGALYNGLSLPGVGRLFAAVRRSRSVLQTTIGLLEIGYFLVFGEGFEL